MWADDVNELHAAAAKLGLRRDWFQCPPAASWEHYDVSLSVKAKALAMGAILTDRYGPLLHREMQRIKQTNNPEMIARSINWIISVSLLTR